jgi:hypothetical protein
MFQRNFAFLSLSLIAAAALGGCAKQENEKPGFIPGYVSQDYGPLVISADELARGQAGTLEQNTDHKAWSSWWYPMSEAVMYDGAGSPLAKYDRFAASVGVRTDAAGEEKAWRDGRFFGPTDGHCLNFAIASLTFDEPPSYIDYNNVRFTRGDLKALLIASSWEVEGIKQYGTAYVPNGRTDPMDIRPEEFHRVVQAELFGKRRGFIVDIDPTEDTWNFPVYWAGIEYRPQGPGVLDVTMTLKVAESRLRKDDGTPDLEFAGTSPLVLPYMTYRLYGETQADGSFRVVRGEWTGDALRAHPDYLLVLPTQLQRSAKRDYRFPDRQPSLTPELVDLIFQKGKRGPS